MSEIHEILKPKLQGKEQLLPRTLQKWDPLDNISLKPLAIVNGAYK